MKKGYFIGMLFVGLCLSSCGKKEEMPSDIVPDAVTPAEAVPTLYQPQKENMEVTPTKGAVAKNPVEELLAQYPAWEYGNAAAGEETVAWKNSNLSNQGYLCEAENGMIYYNLPNDTGLYYGRADGTERVKVVEQEACYMQMEAGKLYFMDEDDGHIYCYQQEEKSVTRLDEQYTGEFAVIGECMYYCGADGIYCKNLIDGTEERLVSTGTYCSAWMTATDKALIYVLIDPVDPGFVTNGLLFGYSLESQKAYFICRYAWMPSLIGNQVFYQDFQSGMLTSLDLNSGEKKDYGLNTTRVSVETDEKFYCNYLRSICQVDYTPGLEQEVTENKIFGLESDTKRIEQCYQTAGMLYMYVSDGTVYYYNKEDGSTGSFE